MKFRLQLLVAALFVTAAQAAVLATVGTAKITDEDVSYRLKKLPAQYTTYYSSEEGKKKP